MTPADRILNDLAGVVRRTFPDRDFPDAVTADTTVVGDLGLASIDVVVLAEQLGAFYAKQFPFGAFLRGLRDRGADDIALGDLVRFLQAHV
jgi:acyl carrier protein